MTLESFVESWFKNLGLYLEYLNITKYILEVDHF